MYPLFSLSSSFFIILRPRTWSLAEPFCLRFSVCVGVCVCTHSESSLSACLGLRLVVACARVQLSAGLSRARASQRYRDDDSSAVSAKEQE
jgi:hypothetical protein